MKNVMWGLFEWTFILISGDNKEFGPEGWGSVVNLSLTSGELHPHPPLLFS